MQYLLLVLTVVTLLGFANSNPIFFEAATVKQAQGLDPIPAKFGSEYSDSRTGYVPETARPASKTAYSPSNNRPASGAYGRNDIDTTYSIYRTDLKILAKELQGRASTQRTSTDDNSRAAYRTAQNSFTAFRTAARPTTTLCAAFRLIPAENQQTAVKYVAFVQHTADEAYEHSINGDGASAYSDFCLIDDYMAAVSSYIEGAGVYNGKSIGTY